MSEVFEKLVKKRVLFLSRDIDVDVATEICAQLILLNTSSKKEITLYINCSGGELSGLWSIYDTIQSITSPVKTICLGEASSSAAVILMAGTPGMRYANPHSTIMLHSIQLDGLSGSTTKVTADSKRYQRDNLVLMEVMAKHTGQSVSKIKKDCLDDKYFTAEEAVKYGIIDKIVDFQKILTNKQRQ